ncbi:hypothetical protein Q2T40_06975 [Winogradskyella maritima]|uniref:DUF6588 family protein n=1 Tax=Winogradskyella maritima TaxID=1517766 RepID=A0ABV8AK11_9FLAO|nr:hypothetical protein [Winogradskyella maritima]
MKRLLLLIALSLVAYTTNAQQNVNDLLAAGVQDAKQFTSDYIDPASDGLAYGINNGWFNSAEVGGQFKFQLSVIANANFIKDEHKTFSLNVADYNNVRFPDGSPSINVATALGHNDPDITVIVEYDDPIFGGSEVELILPTGIGAENINIIPTAFLQGSFNIFDGTALKARFFPKVESEDAEIGLYGVGIQQEFTKWLPAESVFPVAISGLVSYTHLDATYDFTDTSTIDGENQKIDKDVRTFLGQLIVGTKLKVFNFYGGIGYLAGTSNSDFLGTYRVSDGFLFSEEITDPFSIEKDISGIRASVGANVKIGFFGINADYTIAEFNSASLGLNFSF